MQSNDAASTAGLYSSDPCFIPSAVDSGPDINPDELPDLTDELQPDRKSTVGSGSFGIVYRCPRTTNVEVAVKMVIIPCGAKRDMLTRNLRRELGIWRRLDHPNIVPLLGKTSGVGFGSEHDCMVSMWMPGGTLSTFIKDQGAMLVTSRVQLIKDIANGLNYLHSMHIVHGDFHPGNVLIDGQGNARITDFGLSQLLLPVDDGMFYLQTLSVHPGAVMWAAPELVYPQLYPKWNEDGKPRATLNSDIYSLGNMILFILSEKMPWPDVPTAWKRLKKRQIPQRRGFSAISNDFWKFVRKCWSPMAPDVRPSAKEVLSFISDNLKTSLGVTPKNVILFGETGVGKSSVINLMAGRDVALTSSNLEGCTLKAREYSFTLSNSNTSLRIFDTVGLEESDMGLNTFMGAIEKAQELIMSLHKAGGIDLLLFCVKAGRQTAAMQRNYRLFSEILCNNRVPLALVITNLENEDVMENWWERNERTFEKYGVSSVAHACITAIPGPPHVTLYAEKRDQSQKALQKLFHDTLSSDNPSYIQDIRDWLATFTEKLQPHLTGRMFLEKKELVKRLEARCALHHSEALKLAEIIIAKR